MTLNDLAQKLLTLERKNTQDETRKKRLKGASLCVESIQEVQSGLFTVASRTTAARYQVMVHWCTCPDNEYRNNQEIVCSHREAVKAYEKAKKSLHIFQELERLQIAI